MSSSFTFYFRDAFKRRPLFLYFRGSVFPRVLVPVVIFAVYSAVFVFFASLGLAPLLHVSLVPILTIVTGLLVSLRANSSYDRWWEGRKLWSSLTANIRSFSRVLWYSIEREADGVDVDDVTDAMNLLVAFAFAIKHHLRGEDGYQYSDLTDRLPRGYLAVIENRRNKRVDKERRGRRDTNRFDNLPLEILTLLFNYSSMFKQHGKLDPGIFNHLSALTHSMTEQLSSFERILTTPIPFAFMIHLRQMIVLYCVSLPPQLYTQTGWYCIPITAIAAFTFFGVDAIGKEIENPFGYDANDLPVDKFCNDLLSELVGVFESKELNPQEWKKKNS